MTNTEQKQALTARHPQATIPMTNEETKPAPTVKLLQVTIPMTNTETKPALTEEIPTAPLPNTTNTGTRSEPTKQILQAKQHTMTSTEEK